MKEKEDEYMHAIHWLFYHLLLCPQKICSVYNLGYFIFKREHRIIF